MRYESIFQPGKTRRSAWLPPLASVATLFALFAGAMAVRHSPLAEAGRPVMIALSTIASVAIAVYGFLMIMRGRVHRVASIIAGLLMIVIGLFTANHVLS
jgi:hypothetical protein